MSLLLTGTMDARPLAAARILVGLVSIGFTFEWVITLARAASGKFLTLPVSAYLPPPTLSLVWVLLAVSVGASIAMVLGIAGRVPALLVAGVSAFVLLIDQQTYSNHLVLLMMLALFLGCSGAAQAWTVSRTKRATRVPAWPAFLIKVQITTLYVWTAVAKINPQYLSGEVLQTYLQPWVPIPETMLPAVALASIATEAFLAVALWIPRIRTLALVTGAALHVGIVVMLDSPAPLVGFGVLMLSGYILFAWNPRHAESSAPAPSKKQPAS